MDKRIFVEKKLILVKSDSLVKELQHNLRLKTLKDLRIVQVYDVLIWQRICLRAEKHIFPTQVTDTVFWMKDTVQADLRTILSLPLKACLVNLTNGQHLLKLCCWWFK